MNLVQLRTPDQPPEPTTPPHPLDGFVSCHEKIRHFTDLSARLCAPGLAPEAAREVARSIRRYFCEALPLHEADEDLSLAPRLRRLKAPDDVLRALEVVTRQHPDIDRVVGRMLPLWEAVEEDPERLGTLAEQLARASDRLSVIWTPHLSLEEATIFPAARELLPPEEVESLQAEMRERRAPPPA